MVGVEAQLVLREHQPQHHVAPAQGGVHVQVGIEMVGRGDEACEHRRLRHGELLGRFGEIRLRCRLHPVGTLAEVDGVEVLGDDLVLREAILQLPCQGRLLELASEGVGVADVQVLHQLLGDRRAALHDGARDGVVVGGPGDGLHVEAVVVVEAPILDRHRRVTHGLGHLVETQDHPVLPRVQLGDDRAVGRVQERRLREGQRVVIFDAWQAARRQQRRQRAEAGEEGKEPFPHRGRV